MAETTTTANQGLPLPDDNDSYLKSVPDYMAALALAVEVQLVMRFATMAAFNSKVPVPVDGMLFYVTADKSLYIISDGAPQRVWPTQPKITVGTGDPVGPGVAGELYVDITS
jgi:hypothetical protein